MMLISNVYLICWLGLSAHIYVVIRTKTPRSVKMRYHNKESNAR